VNQFFILLGISSWKPLLGALLLPPVPLILLTLVGTRIVLSRRGLGWLIVLGSAVMLWLSASTGTARLMSRVLLDPPDALSQQRIAELKAQVQAKQPVAIVVLGGGSRPFAPEYGMSTLSETSMERLRYGLWLGRETGAPVAFSGGIGWGQTTGTPTAEAQVAARIAAQEFGRPLKWTEERSRDTRENGAYAVALLKEQGIQRAVIVTHHSHMVRALRAFRDAAQGSISFEAAPIELLDQPAGARDWLPSTHGLARVRYVLHEFFGLVMGA